MVETFPVTSPTFASIDQDHRDLGAAPDTADDWELPAVDDDSTINLLHTMLGHLPSGRFETRPDCRAFILELYRTRGFNLTLILGAKWPEEAKDLIMRLRGLGITDADLGLGSTAEHISSQAEAKFEALLWRIRPALGELVQGKLGLTPWALYKQGDELSASNDALSHLDNLALPQAGRSEIPSLLLDGLGINPNRDAIDNLMNFMNGGHKYFINAAGSGKTRLCLEAMCKKYAFYFTCADPKGTLSNAFADTRKASEIGSCDLFNVFKELADSLSQQDLSLLSKPSLEAVPLVKTSRMQTAQRNSDKARHLLRRVLAARLCLLAEYLDKAHTHAVINTMESRRAWMHLQVQPHILCLQDIDDVFVSLAEALRRASDAYVVELAETSLKRINALLYPKEVNKYNYDIDIEIPTIIDEAQEGSFQLPNAFLTASSTDEMGNFRTRPFLREVAAHWSTFHASDRCSVQFIITGTDLSLNHPRKGSIAKLDLWSVAVFMGSFRDRDELHAYLNRYLPSSLLDSPEGKVLLERIWYWLRGRYRLTSSFIQYLLGCAELDGFRANKYPMDLPGIPPPDYCPIEFEKLDIDCIETLRQNVYHRMVRGLKPWYAEDVTGSLLRVGLGQLPILARSATVQIYEPLIIMAAFTWFNKLAHRQVAADPRERPFAEPLFCSMVKSLRSREPQAFENLLAYYFSQVFSASSRSKLSEVFTFPRAHPTHNGEQASSTPSEVELELGSCRATLVSFYSKNGDYLEGSFDYPPNTREGETPGYPGTLGVSEEDSVYSFESPNILRHETDTPASILFPAKYMGPDLLFMLKLEKEGQDAPTYLWVAVQATLRTAESVGVNGREVTEAIDSVTPENFFTSRKKNSGKQGFRNYYDKFAEHMLQHQFKEKTLSALKDGLPKGKATPNAGTYSLLRVVAHFPRPVNLKSVFDRDDDHKHPLVALDTEDLKRTTRHQFPPDALQEFERDETVAPKRKRNEHQDDESTLGVEFDDESDGDNSDNEVPRKMARLNTEEDTVTNTMLDD